MGSLQLCQRSVCRCVRTLWGVGISFDIGIRWAAVGSWQWRDAPHHWSTVVPIRADAVEHDLGLPDGILDG